MFTINLLSKIKNKNLCYSILLPGTAILDILTSPFQLNFVCLMYYSSKNPNGNI